MNEKIMGEGRNTVNYKMTQIKDGRHISFLAFLAVLFFCFSISGCSWSKFNFKNLFKTHKPEPSAEELMQKGLDKFYSHKYSDALDAFQKVKERYPFSKYATMAELRVADAHYYEGEYPEAVAAYEDFSRLHPQHPEIPRVFYQIGMCHYKQRLSIDRDQTETRDALEAFERVTKSYPKSEYAKKAEWKIAKCKELLARHELYVANFYYRTGKYRAAMLRLETVRNSYSDVQNREVREEFKQLYIKCYKDLSKESLKGGLEKEKKQRMFSDVWDRVHFWHHKEKEANTNIEEPPLLDDQLEPAPKTEKTASFDELNAEQEKSFWQKLLFWKHEEEQEEVEPSPTPQEVSEIGPVKKKEKKSFLEKLEFWKHDEEQVPTQTAQKQTATATKKVENKEKKSFWDKLMIWKHDDNNEEERNK